ncbi:hypothetical protein [Microbacterium sediminis]|uniref:Uncharacterized protein n=1 Tax=Microbacterium sediminis TaxID=904291 RepID=A0A1B9NFY5_9MICO|nr:hypothetical protein [Microbacterium sediminis]OCG75515.1 hypothetical protein A7J15_00135 [Microbacterium sediminis]QBR73909.1 hypothetical protein E3O41_05390 [Microbacterium sediminis]
MTSIQTLSDPDRRVIARWAAACAERVLPLFNGGAEWRELLADALARRSRPTGPDRPQGRLM